MDGRMVTDASKATATRTAERVLHHHTAQYHSRCDLRFVIRLVEVGMLSSSCINPPPRPPQGESVPYTQQRSKRACVHHGGWRGASVSDSSERRRCDRLVQRNATKAWRSPPGSGLVLKPPPRESAQ